MAFALIQQFTGATHQQPYAVLAEVGRTYPGPQFHVAGPMEGGWCVVD